MSLDWNLRDIENMDSVCFKEWSRTEESGTIKKSTEGLIFLTMIVGINEITEDNAQEFYLRVKFWEQLFGIYMGTKDEDGKVSSVFTPKLIEDHIGLWTNATTKTITQFRSDQWSRWVRENGYKLQGSEEV